MPQLYTCLQVPMLWRFWVQIDAQRLSNSQLCHWFLWFLSKVYPKLDQDCYFAHPFKSLFTYHPIIQCYTIRATERISKITHIQMYMLLFCLCAGLDILRPFIIQIKFISNSVLLTFLLSWIIQVIFPDCAIKFSKLVHALKRNAALCKYRTVLHTEQSLSWKRLLWMV